MRMKQPRPQPGPGTVTNFTANSHQGGDRNLKQMKMRKPSLLAIFASLVVAEVGALSFEFPVVTLSYGSFRGQVLGPTTQFLGMPFAASPYVTTYSVVCKSHVTQHW